MFYLSTQDFVVHHVMERVSVLGSMRSVRKRPSYMYKVGTCILSSSSPQMYACDQISTKSQSGNADHIPSHLPATSR